MAINYTSLVDAKTNTSSIKAWVNHALIPAEDILTEAQAWIYQRLRAWEMRVTATGTVAIDDDSAALPARFIAPLRFSIHGGIADLPFRHEQLWNPWKDEDGLLMEHMPTMACILNGVLEFDGRTDEAFNYDFAYYEAKAPLAADNLTNFLTVRFPTLLRRACMMFGYEFRKDWDAHARQEKMAYVALAEANQASDDARLGSQI